MPVGRRYEARGQNEAPPDWVDLARCNRLDPLSHRDVACQRRVDVSVRLALHPPQRLGEGLSVRQADGR